MVNELFTKQPAQIFGQILGNTMATIVNGHAIPSISQYMEALRTPQWKLDRGMPRLSRRARKLEAREWRGRVIQRLKSLGPMGGAFVERA